MLGVRDWPRSRLVAEMNRYTATPIRLADRSLGDLLMSGSFRASDQQSFLLSLEYSAPVRVDRTTPGAIVVRRTSPRGRQSLQDRPATVRISPPDASACSGSAPVFTGAGLTPALTMETDNGKKR